MKSRVYLLGTGLENAGDAQDARTSCMREQLTQPLAVRTVETTFAFDVLMSNQLCNFLPATHSFCVPAIQKRTEVARRGCKKFNACEREFLRRRGPHHDGCIRFVDRIQKRNIAVVNRAGREQNRSSCGALSIHPM